MRQVRQREVNDQLKKIGFGGMDDPDLVKQMAFCIGYREHTLQGKHDHFRKVLLSVEPHLRTQAYEQMRPYLSFTPKALDEYIIDGKHDAEALQLPVQMPDGTFVSYRDFHGGTTPGPSLETMAAEASLAAMVGAEIDHANANRALPAAADGAALQMKKGSLTVKCGKCTREVAFEAVDELAGYAAARRAGWVFAMFENRKTKEQKERPICPTCPAVRVALALPRARLIQ